MAIQFTDREKAKEARREVTYRQFVYSKRVTDGKMTDVEARRKIAIMTQIAEDYERWADKAEAAERLI